MLQNWSKTKQIKSVIENVRNKNGGARASRAPPHFWLYLFSYTFDLFGFGPIFDQFFWVLFWKLIQIKEMVKSWYRRLRAYRLSKVSSTCTGKDNIHNNSRTTNINKRHKQYEHE